MNLEKLDRSVGMHCSTCAGQAFRRDDALEDGPIECVGCGRVFTREELLRENGELVENAVKEMAADFKDELRKMFKGSKIIKVR